jgi:hypothetical protein
VGLQHSTYKAYGFEIPSTTGFEALDEAMAAQPEQEPDRRVHHQYLGDFERLFLLVACEEIEENAFSAITAADFTRYEIPAWSAALHRMAASLGHNTHPLPTWLVLHNHS